MYIKKDYLDLKIEELNARYELAIILNDEREKIKAEKARIRDEERAQLEYENARRKAEEEEKIYLKALNDAKKKLGLLTDGDLESLSKKLNL